MNIYFVERTDDWDYYEYDSCVVIASSKDEARNKAKKLLSINDKYSLDSVTVLGVACEGCLDELNKTRYGNKDSCVDGLVVASFNRGLELEY